MAFNYETDFTDKKNQLRFLIQDTVELEHFLEDEEILFIADNESNLFRAASQLCLIIANKITQMASMKDENFIFDADKKTENYLKLAAEFEVKANQNASTNLSFASLVDTTITKDSAFTRDLHFSK